MGFFKNLSLKIALSGLVGVGRWASLEVYFLVNLFEKPIRNRRFFFFFFCFFPDLYSCCVSILTLSVSGTNFNRQHFELVFLFFSGIRLWQFMQIVSLGDKLHDMSKPVFWEK